jgi:hypothetical protein
MNENYFYITYLSNKLYEKIVAVLFDLILIK